MFEKCHKCKKRIWFRKVIRISFPTITYGKAKPFLDSGMSLQDIGRYLNLKHNIYRYHLKCKPEPPRGNHEHAESNQKV